MGKSKKVKNHDSKRIIFLLCSVVVFIVILISTVFSDWTKIASNKSNTKELQHYYVELQEEEASLNSEVIKLQDADYVARYAREKYMYTKEGETILKIVESVKK